MVATTTSDRKILLDGDWLETGEWVEVASPFDGSLVARVAKAGAAEARAAVAAAERAMREPLPAHKRAEILVRVAGALGKRADEVARQITAEAGKPLKAARVEVARAMSTSTSHRRTSARPSSAIRIESRSRSVSLEACAPQRMT